MTASVLKQDKKTHTNDWRKTSKNNKKQTITHNNSKHAISYDKTQHAQFEGNPLFQATNQSLNNSYTIHICVC